MRTRHTALAVLVCAAVAAGCDTASDRSGPPEGRVDPEVATSSGPATSSVTGHDDARDVDLDATPVVLAITNQSFDDPDVDLTVTADGEQVVARSFPVEGQHTQTFFGLDLPPGEHTVP